MNLSVISNVPNVANQKGAVAFEYALIIALVGTALAGALSAFMDQMDKELGEAFFAIQGGEGGDE